MMDETFLMRRILRITLLAAGLGIAIWITWFVLNHGIVEVNSDNTTDVSILSNSSDKKAFANGKGKVTAILRKGSYIVEARKNLALQRTTVSAMPFRITEASLSPQGVQETQPVTNFQTTSFHIADQQLGFVDSDSGRLSYITISSPYSYSDERYWFENASWLSSTSGYALAHEIQTDRKAFVRFDGTSITEVNLPSPLTSQTYFAYVTGNDKNLYIIEDGTLYRYIDGTFRRIANVDKKNFLLSATTDYVSMLNRNEEEACELQLLNIHNTSIKKIPIKCIQSPDYLYTVEWSDDGKRFIVSSGGEVSVYASDTYQKIISVPDINASSGIWVANDSLVYASQNRLWRYNLTTNTSDVIATTPQYVTLLNLQRDGDDYYFVGRADSAISLYKTSRPSALLDSVKLSESNMHELSSGCRIRYSDIGSLRIIASTSEQNKVTCTDTIRSYLSSIGVSQSLPIEYVLSDEYGYSD